MKKFIRENFLPEPIHHSKQKSINLNLKANWLYVMVCDVSRIHTQPWLWLKKSMYPKNFLLKLNWLYVMAVEGNVHSCTSK